jgi:REP element-mobilizing transposase RayT
MVYHQRHLSHWHPEGAALFVTWQLHGSLPDWLLNGTLSLAPTETFLLHDHHLDTAQSGPLWLKKPRIAELVTDSLLYTEQQLKLCDLRAWVIMPNHVHAVLVPRAALERITKAFESLTAGKANRMLHREGRPFWQQESFERWVRDWHEMERAVHYVEHNPVKAGLVDDAGDWSWSSANGAFRHPRPSLANWEAAGGRARAGAIPRPGDSASKVSALT